MSSMEEDLVEHQYDLSETVRFSSSGLGWFPMLFLSAFGALFVWVGYVMLTSEPADYRGVIGLLLGMAMVGLVLFALAKQRSGKMPCITLSPQGFSTQPTGTPVISWSNVTGLNPIVFRGMSLLGVELNDAGRAELGTNKVVGAVSKRLSGTGLSGDMTINSNMVSIPFDQFMVLFIGYAAQHGQQQWALDLLSDVTENQDEAVA